jgi:hypothetical protein
MADAAHKYRPRLITGVGKLHEGEIDSGNRMPVGTEVLSARPRRRVEVVSTGIDEQLQGIGSDPFNSLSWIGLRVPPFVNNVGARYLFVLCSFEVAKRDRARIVGLRMGWSLGVKQTFGGGVVRIFEKWVEDPTFKPPMGNVSWHLRKTPLFAMPNPGLGPVQPPLQNFAFRNSQTPALLYQTATIVNPGFYVGLGAYTPPNAGMPYGVGVTPELQTFYDLKTSWNDAGDWRALDIPVEGPARVTFYASVQQTPQQKQGITLPTTPEAPVLPPDELFLANFPVAQIWRVAGALAVESEDAAEFRSMIDHPSQWKGKCP